MRTGMYIMRLFSYPDRFTTHRVRVEVIGESAKSYHVRLLERGPTGQQVGTTYWPRKHNVVNINAATEIRLPYKD